MNKQVFYIIINVEKIKSVSPSPVEVLTSNPVVLQSQLPWGFPGPLPDPKVG